jgi:uncharacterized RDD family membrane protein YckC
MGRRLAAWSVDAVATLVVVLVPVAATVPELAAEGLPAEPSPLVLVGAVGALVLGVVQWWLLGTRGWTLGRRLLGMRVVSVTGGAPVGLGRALVRLLVPGAAGVVPVLGPTLVHVSPFFDGSGRRQGWHDLAAGTVVLDVRTGLDPTAPRRADAQLVSRRLEAVLAPAGASPQAGTPPQPGTTQDPGASRQPGTSAQPPRPDPIAVVPGATPRPQVVPAPAPPLDRVPGSAPDELPEETRGVVDPERDGRPPALPAPPAEPTADRAPVTRHVPVTRLGEVAAEVPVTAEGATGDTGPIPGLSSQRRIVPPAHEVLTSVPFPSAPLDEEVERTRLRPARSKVPEMASAGAHATVDITDGQRVTFSGTALIGRNPTPRPGEDGCRLIRVADPGRSVSKTHLLLGVDRNGLWVRDRHSTNGTVVTLADGQQILCGADQQVRLPPGASVAFGDYGLSVVTADVV